MCTLLKKHLPKARQVILVISIVTAFNTADGTAVA